MAYGQGYSILYETSNGELKWFPLAADNTGKIIKKSDKDYSYLVREEINITKATFQDSYVPYEIVVTLYLKVDDLNGDSYK